MPRAPALALGRLLSLGLRLGSGDAGRLCVTLPSHHVRLSVRPPICAGTGPLALRKPGVRSRPRVPGPVPGPA